MKHFIIIPALFLLLSLHFQAAGGSYPEKTILKALKLAGKSLSDHMDKPVEGAGLEPMVVDAGLKNYAVQDTLFRLKDASPKPLGYLVVSSAMGRFERFDFMTLYDTDKKLIEVAVLTYRSEHGSQVSSRIWLQKFTRLEPGADIQYGVHIDALSGATFSATSLTREIDRLNKLILEIDH